MRARRVRVGDVVLVDNKPLQITRMEQRRAGRQGHAKMLLTGRDVFSGAATQLNIGSDVLVPVCCLHRHHYLLINVDPPMLLDENEAWTVREDVAIPEQFMAIAAHFDQRDVYVTTTTVGDRTEITSMRFKSEFCSPLRMLWLVCAVFGTA